MQSLLKILFILTLVELFIGGGGRVFEFAGTTLRILLFTLNILLAGLLYVYRDAIPRYVVIIVFVTLASLVFYGLLGWLNGASAVLIAEDIKPLSYLFSIIFFSYYIDRPSRVELVISLVKKSSIFMAIGYIAIQLLIRTGKISFIPFYEYVNTVISPSDFIFRGTEGLFFYKGFLYMVVGLIFWLHTKNSRFRSIPILIITIAMILTGTRGFIIMFILLYALFYGIPLLLRLNVKMLILAAVVFFGSLYFFNTTEIGNKAISDSIRLEQTIQVLERVNPVSFLIGHGFGIGVPVREVHFEIAYLEIFHKQGIMGLALWALLFVYLYKQYGGGNYAPDIRKAYLLSFMFVLLLSVTNPFLNNPIGISLFMIGLASLKVLNKKEKQTDAGGLQSS